MTESKESYLLPVIPKDEKPVFPEFDVDENKPLLHNEEKVKILAKNGNSNKKVGKNNPPSTIYRIIILYGG